MTKARNLADLISDGVIGTTELADDVITPVQLSETGNYVMAQLNVTGTVSADDIVLSDANAPSITLTDTTNTVTTLIQSGNSSSTIGTTTSHGLNFVTNNADRMLIDASGNLLVGTTENNVTNNSGNNPGINIGVAGIKGFMSSARYQGPPLSINRLGNDGDIQLFSKDGSTVGSIGTVSGTLYIGSPNGSGAFAKFNNNSITPSTSAGAGRDNAIDLGASSARFKDLYLSGSIANPSGNLTVDVSGDIVLDAAGADIGLNNSGTEYGKFNLSGNSLNIHSSISNGDIIFKGNSGGSAVTALTLDMSAAGEATFNSGISVGNNATFLGSQNTIRADDAFLRVEETDGTDIAYFGDISGTGIGGSYLYNHGGTATVQIRADQASTVTHGINLNNTSTPRLTMTSSSGPYGFIEANTVGSVAISADGGNSGSNTNITFKVDDDEKVRLDTSGNFLIGTTDNTPYNNSSDSTADNGIALGSSGIFSVAKHNDSPIIANRTGSDGGVIKLHKSGVDRGGIGLNNGDPYISRASGSGMRWYNGAVVPTNDAGNDSNNTMDLGSSSVRFKHGYFSGNLYGNGSNLTGVGGSTAFGAVGTYIWGRPANRTSYSTNATASSLLAVNNKVSSFGGVAYWDDGWQGSDAQTSVSGTWRHMGGAGAGVGKGQPGIWVRIS